MGFSLDAFSKNKAPKLIINGVFDGPLVGKDKISSTPDMIELRVLAGGDLGLCSIKLINQNDKKVWLIGLPEREIQKDEFYYLTNDSAAYIQYFGFPAIIPSYVNFNLYGNDYIELLCEGMKVDTFGELLNADQDKTIDSVSWDYTYSWAHRIPLSVSKNQLREKIGFNPSHWAFSDINSVENCTFNDACDSPYPLGLIPKENYKMD